MSADKQSLEGLKLDRSPEVKAPASLGIFKWAIVALIAGGIAAFWFLRPRVVEVRTFVISETDPTEPRTLLNASGYVTARREATVSSKITGKVVEVRIEEGQRVEEGEVLARLDDVNVAATLRLAEANVAAARSALNETKVRLDVALRELARIRNLQQTGITTEASLDQARGEVDSLKARLELQSEQVEVADRERAVYAQQAEDTIIRAPFGGIVTAKNAQPGEMISPISAGGGYTRTGICTLVDMTSLEIEVDVNESYLGRVREAQPVEATLDAYPDWRIPASVIAIIPTADRQKSTVKVRVGFKELDPRLLPEMAVRVAFLGPPPLNSENAVALFVPSRAILKMDGQTQAWVVTDDQATLTEVRVGDDLSGQTPVLSGLAAGGRLVVEGFENLREGSRVREKTR